MCVQTHLFAYKKSLLQFQWKKLLLPNCMWKLELFILDENLMYDYDLRVNILCEWPNTLALSFVYYI